LREAGLRRGRGRCGWRSRRASTEATQHGLGERYGVAHSGAFLCAADTHVDDDIPSGRQRRGAGTVEPGPSHGVLPQLWTVGTSQLVALIDRGRRPPRTLLGLSAAFEDINIGVNLEEIVGTVRRTNPTKVSSGLLRFLP